MPAPEERRFSSEHGAAPPEDKLSQPQLWGSTSPGRQRCISCLDRSLNAWWKSWFSW